LAGGDEVVDIIGSAIGNRDDMISFEFDEWRAPAAILATKPVSLKNFKS